MKSLITEINNVITEGIDTGFEEKYLHKFLTSFKKFKEKLDEDEEIADDIKKTIDEWVDEVDRKGGLPRAYGRYEQFVYALLSFNRSGRDGKGSLYPQQSISKLLALWRRATGETIKDMYERGSITEYN